MLVRQLIKNLNKILSKHYGFRLLKITLMDKIVQLRTVLFNYEPQI